MANICKPFSLRKSSSKASNFWSNWAPVLLVAIAVIIVYWPSLSATFIWDDDVVLTANPLLRGPFHDIWFSTAPIDYFPLTYSTLWVEWHCWGANPLGYHIVNIFLHLFSSLILWRVLRRLNIPAAWLGTLLFAIHPVNVESVAWVAEIKNVLAMFFYTMTWWAFVRFAQSRRLQFYVISLAAFLLSLLAKPSAAAWPLIALGILMFATRKSSEARAGKTSEPWTNTRRLLWVTPFVILAAGLSLATIWFQNHRSIGTDVVHHYSFSARIAAAGTAVWFYLSKALVPYPLCFVYPTWTSNFQSIVSWVPVMALIVLFGVLWRSRNGWGRPMLLALTYYVLLLAPVLGFFDIYFQRFSYVADHWQYFALPGITVLLAVGLKRFKLQNTIGVAIAVAFGCMTFAQTRVYHDEETLWAAVLQKNPTCWLALNNVAYARQQSGQIDEAIALYKKSLAGHPEQPEANSNLAQLLLNTGDTTNAMAHLRAAIEADAHYAPAHYLLASVYQGDNRFDQAISEYRLAIKYKPDYAPAHNNLGCLLALQGKREEGLAELRLATAYNSNYGQALGNLGSMLNDAGKADEALPLLKRAVTLEPNSADVHLNLGNSFYRLKQTSAAQAEYEQALQINPNAFQARFGLASCLFASGFVEDARKLFEQVLKTNPDHAESHYQLAIILLNQRQQQQALQHLEAALRLRPDWPDALNNLAWAMASAETCSNTDRIRAVRLAERSVELTGGNNPSALDTLSVAWARNEVFTKAIENSTRALQLAQGGGDTNLAKEIQGRLALYRKRMAYTEQR